MGYRTRLHAALAAAITLLTAAGPAAAETVVQTSSTFVSANPGHGPGASIEFFAPFDASLGTLMGSFARIRYINTFAVALSVDFNSPGLPYRGEGQGQMSSTLSLTVDGERAFSIDLLASPSFTNFQALGSAQNGAFESTSSESDIPVPVGLAYRFDLQVHDLGCSASTGTPDVSAACSMDAESRLFAFVTVTHNYSPVPLPANLGLLALGLGGLGFLQRRR